MKWLYSLVSLGFLWIFSDKCGRSIKERDWAKSVFWFLLALGMILMVVKNSVPF